MTLEELKEDSDWRQSFIVSDADIDQVEEVIACDDGENDGDSWIGIFEMRNGKFIFLSAWCDYTGWGCRDGGSYIETDTLDEAISKFTLGEDDRYRLRDQLKNYEKDWE